MRLGPWHARAIETGWFALDGGAMFGVVPKPLWERKIPADDRNRVGLAVRALLLEEVAGDRKVLIDTGVGTKWSPKLADIYGVDHSRLALEKSLEEVGLRTGDITDVLLTHLHFDHAGGATRRIAGTVVPTFENAIYHVQQRNLDWALNPTLKDRQSYLPENFQPLLDHGVLETLDDSGIWIEGIELIISEGHTTCMQLPRVFGPEGSLQYCADLVPTAAHVPVPWVMAYDNQPLVTMREKEALLERIHGENGIIFFEHDPQGPAARVVRDDKGFSVGERVVL